MHGMSKLYSGDAVITFPDGPTVNASVDLTVDDNETVLFTWGGTAESSDEGSLWNGGQRACTIRIGDVSTGYRVGEAMVITVEPAVNVERVTVRGSGELAEVETDG
jgi:hypothetical protein